MSASFDGTNLEVSPADIMLLLSFENYRTTRTKMSLVFYFDTMNKMVRILIINQLPFLDKRRS
jgi:hypothetical protein